MPPKLLPRRLTKSVRRLSAGDAFNRNTRKELSKSRSAARDNVIPLPSTGSLVASSIGVALTAPTFAENLGNQPLLDNPNAPDVHREIFFNESTFGRKRTAVTFEEAQRLLQHTAESWEEAKNARKKAKRKGVPSNQLLAEEANYLEVSSNALCLLRRSNYCMQKEIHWYKDRYNESKTQHTNFTKILQQCVKEQEQRIKVLSTELRAIQDHGISIWDVLPQNKTPVDRLRILKKLNASLLELQGKVQEAKAQTMAAKLRLHPLEIQHI